MEYIIIIMHKGKEIPKECWVVCIWEGILLMIETVPGSKEQGAYRVTRDNNIDPD